MNNYRWVRGFNDYDNWQASGVSGQGARSFYYPPKTQSCADCHMPLVDFAGSRQSRWQGPLASLSRREYRGGAFVNQDTAQLNATEKFLKSGFITVDIFAVSPADDHRGRRPP